MERILKGLRRFQKDVYPEHREFFEKLATQQRPEALFITCADSRIDPCLLTQTQPGELFICRVIGNIVPHYPEKIGGVSATIEYATAVLQVADIIVCGHTDCGVMKGVLNPEMVASLPNVKSWLGHVKAAREAAIENEGAAEGPEVLLDLTERHVIEQLKHLATHPSVAKRLELGDVNLHGWVYHIGSGAVTAYDAGQKRFLPVRNSSAALERDAATLPE